MIRPSRLATTALLTLLGLLLAGPTAFAAPETPKPGALPGDRQLWRIADPKLTQSSGLALDSSGRYLYTHQDASAPTAAVYALDEKGRTHTTITVPGVTPLDWEDIDRGTTPQGQPALFIADTGDAVRSQGGNRREFRVIRINEPDLRTSSAAVQATGVTVWRLRFPDSSNRNSESLAVHPQTNQVVIVDKKNPGSGQASVWALPPQPSTTEVNTLQRIGSLPLDEATAASFSPDGRLFAVRTYAKVYLWRISGDLGAALLTAPAVRQLPQQGQGESLTFTANGSRLLVGSEGAHSAVWEISLPTQTDPSMAASPPAGSVISPARPTASTGVSRRTQVMVLGGILTLLVVGLVGLGAWSRHRARPENNNPEHHELTF